MMRKPFIVAEISANHLGGLDRALALVDAAADAGCDAVKLQSWGVMSVDRTPLTSGPWKGRSLVDLYKECQTPWEWIEPLFWRAAKRGIEAFSTPFDLESLYWLERLGCPRYKVASFEITHRDLIKAIAATGKPIIISTGMATREEVFDATCYTNANQHITLLKCTSAYPARIEDANLATMRSLRNEAHAVGVSDHTLGDTVAVAAAVLGADMIEKHLTLSRADGGPDAAFSMEPAEMALLVRRCRDAVAAIGEVRYGGGESEQDSRQYRRSWWLVRDVAAGVPVRRTDVEFLRPATGMQMFPENAHAARDLKAGSPLLREDFVWASAA